MRYISLHNHSQFSVQDSPGKYEEYCRRAKELGMTALGVTEHGTASGVFQFYNQTKMFGIKPIFGIEFYVNDKLNREDRKRNHLCGFARNFEGYKALMRLQRLSCENFYYRPLINHQMFCENAGNLIATSACIQSVLFDFMKVEDEKGAERFAKMMFEATGGNFWFELIFLDLKDQKPYNRFLLKLSKKLRIPYIISNDVHFLLQDDEILWDIMRSIRLKKPMKEFEEKSAGRDLWFKGADDILKTGVEYGYDLTGKEYDRGFEATVEVAEKIEEFEIVYPHIEIPKYIADENKAYEFLEELVVDKFSEKLGGTDYMEVYAKRLEYELSVIKEKKFSNYFLVMWDIMEYAKANDIYYGIGRGSAAGSLISYILDITRLDPIKHGLMFERFLTLNREDPPDIDSDFDSERRDEIEEYIRGKYGDKNVVQVLTFGRFGTKGIIRDIGRVFDLKDDKIDVLAKYAFDDKSVVDEMNRYEIDRFADKRIVHFIEKNMEYFGYADRMRGIIRHCSLHASGMVISNNGFERAPVYRVHDKIVCGLQEGAVDREISKFGLLKLDILGLAACSVISHSLGLIKERHGVDAFDYIHSFDFGSDEAKEVYNEFNKDNIEGIFQYSSAGMRKLISQVRIDGFDDLIAINALFRPSVIAAGGCDEFVQNKHNPEFVHYIDGRLKSILAQTYGVVVYQEQILEMLRVLGGFSLVEAENIRYLMKIMHTAKEKAPEKVVRDLDGYFMKLGENCRRNGWPENEIANIVSTIKKYSAYSFNKSHAAAYAYTAFQMMWIKHFFPLEFFVSLFNSASDEDKLKMYVVDSLENHVEIFPVDINKSKEKFIIEGSGIRAGFTVLDGLGEKAAAEIVVHQPYSNIEDFKSRVTKRTVNKKIVSILGAQECFTFDQKQGIIN